MSAVVHLSDALRELPKAFSDFDPAFHLERAVARLEDARRELRWASADHREEQSKLRRTEGKHCETHENGPYPGTGRLCTWTKPGPNRSTGEHGATVAEEGAPS